MNAIRRDGMPNVLIYQLGSLGDTVVSLPAVAATRRHFGPDARLTLLHDGQPGVTTTPRDILDGLGLVDDYIDYPRLSTRVGQIRILWNLWRRLTVRRFDAVVYLAPGERTPGRVARDRLFFRLCGFPRLIGFRAFARRLLYPMDAHGLPGPVPHEASFRLLRLEGSGLDVSKECDLDRRLLHLPTRVVETARAWLQRERRHANRPLVGLCPGSKQPANIWPLERFEALGRRLVAQNQAELLIVGGPSEQAAGELLLNAWGDGLNAAGRFPPLASAALLGECAFVVGLDTGTTHLAAALGVRCVALYGERDNPGRWTPLGIGHRIVRWRVPCAGCRQARCPVANHPCMQGITVGQAWQAVIEMQRDLNWPSVADRPGMDE